MHGENIHLRIYYNTIFPNTKEGDRMGAESVAALGEGPGQPSPERLEPCSGGNLPPLLRWTFQQIIGGG